MVGVQSRDNVYRKIFVQVRCLISLFLNNNNNNNLIEVLSLLLLLCGPQIRLSSIVRRRHISLF